MKHPLWLYDLKSRRWSCLSFNSSSDNDLALDPSTNEPSPRFAHQLVYDHIKKVLAITIKRYTALMLNFFLFKDFLSLISETTYSWSRYCFKTSSLSGWCVVSFVFIPQVHYLFGGNPGSFTHKHLRLDDFWRLNLCRPAREYVLRHCIYLVRKFKWVFALLFFTQCIILITL